MSASPTLQMTPRAWRMIAYSCVGFLIYGLVLITETLQAYQLNNIDRQMQMVEQMQNPDLDSPVRSSTQPAVVDSTATALIQSNSENIP